MALIQLRFNSIGELAQLARAPALHAGGQRFESVILHQIIQTWIIFWLFTYWSTSLTDVLLETSNNHIVLGLMFFDILKENKVEKIQQLVLLINELKVNKGAWWMPRLSEAMKDVISCGYWQIRIDPQISEWGNPLCWWHNTYEQTRRTETSKYPEEEKTTVIP